MSRANYEAMTKAQLKQYFLTHRGDRAVMPRIRRQNQSVSPSNYCSSCAPDFDEKVQVAIRQKLEKATSSDRPQSDNSNTLND